MEANTIKLTSYLGERHRARDSSAGHAIVELYARQQLTASILLRGAEGTGLRHHRHTDNGPQTPGLPEGLPVTVTAVDTREKIEAVLDQTLALNERGLVTLESAILLQEEIGPTRIRASAGEAIELAVYFSSQDTVFAVPAFEEVCQLLYRREVEGATVLPGLDGSARGHRQRSPFLGHGGDTPMVVIAVGGTDLISSVLPELGGLFRHPVITLGRVRICKRDGQVLSHPGQQLSAEKHSSAQWQKLTVYTPDAGQHGHPVHRAIVRELHAAGAQGATTHRGIWGFHGDQPPHGDRRLQLRHHAPVITTVIGTAENISSAFAVIDRLTTEQELVTVENILVVRKAPVMS